MIKKLLAFVLFASSVTLTFVGCSPQTENVDTINDQGKAVMQLDYRDFDRAASEMVQSMIASGTFKKEGGGRYVVAKGRITNDTMQRVDTDQLMAKVEQEMTRSGLIVMTAAVGAGNATKDSLVHDVREIRDSDKADEFNKDTLQAKGQLIAPQRTFAIGDVDRAWTECDVVVSGRVDSGAQEHVYLETQGAVSLPTEDGGLRVLSATQAPTVVQRIIARVLALPMPTVESAVILLRLATHPLLEQAVFQLRRILIHSRPLFHGPAEEHLRSSGQ